MDTETQTEESTQPVLIDKLRKENEELKSKLDVLTDQLDSVSRYSRPGLPSTTEEINQFFKAFKAAELKLNQKCIELTRLEEFNNEMKVTGESS